jgi:hypothetical protein
LSLHDLGIWKAAATKSNTPLIASTKGLRTASAGVWPSAGRTSRIFCLPVATGDSGSLIQAPLYQATTTTSGTGILFTRLRLGTRTSATSSRENLKSSPMGAPRRGQRSHSWLRRPRSGRLRFRGQDGSVETVTTLSVSTQGDTEDSEASLLGL